MGQPSSVKKLPEKILAQVNFLLFDSGWTIDQVVDYLSEAGHPKSRSTVGRYKKTEERVFARLRESREITKAFGTELGDAAVEGKQGRLLVEMARSHIFDFMMTVHDKKGDPLKAQDVAHLGKGLADLGRALRLDQDFEMKIRESAKKEAVQAVEEVAKSEGLSRDTVEKFRDKILGIDKVDANKS